MNNTIFTIIDFETTGLDSTSEQITEVAALKIDENGIEYGSFHTFVRLTEGRKPSPYAKVTEEECATGMDESEALSALGAFCKDTCVVAQYAPFDFSFVKEHFQPKDFICTRTLTFMVEPKENPSLVPTCERNDIKVLNAHRAMDDVLMTKQVFLMQKPKADIKDFDYHNVIVDFKKRPLVFAPENARIIVETD